MRGGGTLETEARSRAGSGVTARKPFGAKGWGRAAAGKASSTRSASRAAGSQRPSGGRRRGGEGGARKPRPSPAPPRAAPEHCVGRRSHNFDQVGQSPLTSSPSTSLQLGQSHAVFVEAKTLGYRQFRVVSTQELHRVHGKYVASLEPLSALYSPLPVNPLNSKLF